MDGGNLRAAIGLPYHTHSNVPAFSSRMLTLATSWATTSPLNVTLAPSLTSNKEPEGKSCPADYATKTMGGRFVRSSGRVKLTFVGPAESRLDIEHFGLSLVIRHCNCAIDQICTIDDSSIKPTRYHFYMCGRPWRARKHRLRNEDINHLRDFIASSIRRYR